MEKLYVSDREIVVPGDILAEGIEYLPSGKAYREGEKIFASVMGMASVKGRVVKVIPLAGRYMPKKMDALVGKVIAVLPGGWSIEINSPYAADLPLAEGTSEYIPRGADLTRFFDLGDYIFAEVTLITETKFVKLSASRRPYRRLRGGILIEISPVKVPRIIGKQGSMVGMIKDATGCEIVVGQNGWVWAKGTPEKEALVEKIVKTIEVESHKKGLTDKIKKMLEESK
ncbi:MAG: exosome complex RNA-binding protein Rrp4 [DPANN group archaeon]|nr:exosome complex RNA-binding protein Rrp4 [DPANN group archaeon]